MIPVLLLVQLAFVSSILPTSVPNPKTSPELCGLSKESKTNERWICDADRILAKETFSQINDLITQTHSETKKQNPSCPVEIAVVIIKEMDSGYGGSSIGAESFAKELHKIWGVGSKECKNGILIFFSLNDRKWFISTGSGATEIISSRRIGYIRDEITPFLKKSEYGEAIFRMVKSISELMIAGKEDDNNAFFWYICSLIFLVVVVFFPKWIIYGFIRMKEIIKSKEYENKTGKLSNLQKKLEKDKIVDASTCPICLDDFTMRNGTKIDCDVLVCGHLFHRGCINHWLRTHDVCPLCRRANPRDEIPRNTRPKPIDSEWIQLTSERLRFEFAPYVDISSRESTRYWNEWSTGYVNASNSESSSWGGDSSGNYGGDGGSW